MKATDSLSNQIEKSKMVLAYRRDNDTMVPFGRLYEELVTIKESLNGAALVTLGVMNSASLSLDEQSILELLMGALHDYRKRLGRLTPFDSAPEIGHIPEPEEDDE